MYMCVRERERERERNLLGAVHAIRNREAKMGVTHDMYNVIYILMFVKSGII